MYEVDGFVHRRLREAHSTRNRGRRVGTAYQTMADIDDRDQTGSGFLAINNCMNEVCHGFRIAVSEWRLVDRQWKKSRRIRKVACAHWNIWGNTLEAFFSIRLHREKHPSGLNPSLSHLMSLWHD